MKRLVLVLAFLLCGLAHAGGEQFTCTFGSEVKISSLDPAKPLPKVISGKPQRFTFMIDSYKPLTGSYINLDHGTKIPIFVMNDSGGYVFVEWNNSDNHFVVSIFSRKSLPQGGFPAVLSFHAEKTSGADDFYAQSIVAGRCY